ncbi:hypothetical protein AYO44_02520 [Planctomycetaceae bacterium SCGC AG-212-F19]|nr:hypothetical protein AYO44_02520 [Planctomycetaceae bacterium SCGC AG-212-F19]
MGAYKNLGKASTDLKAIGKLLNPPAVDGNKAKTDLKTLKTFIETSKTAWATKTQAVIAELDKVLTAVEKASKALKEGKAKDASTAIQTAITTATAVDAKAGQS